MANAEERPIFAGQWGHTHTLTVKDQDGNVVGLGSADTLEVVFRRMGGVEIVKPAVLVTPGGADGKIRYTVVPGDTVDAEAGRWTRRSKVTFPDKYLPSSTREAYHVHEPGSK